MFKTLSMIIGSNFILLIACTWFICSFAINKFYPSGAWKIYGNFVGQTNYNLNNVRGGRSDFTTKGFSHDARSSKTWLPIRCFGACIENKNKRVREMISSFMKLIPNLVFEEYVSTFGNSFTFNDFLVTKRIASFLYAKYASDFIFQQCVNPEVSAHESKLYFSGSMYSTDCYLKLSSCKMDLLAFVPINIPVQFRI